ncbi:MAG: hypothetical protein MI864_10240 [Pseudomonadales bacterium]|uniref:Uncharacterized protein n=1 Tax=Oleiphilus messinensis TaxID=141451 RepID=A0A1Y0I773_9GAMM|nr:hypothetical protein [Oleiphilus messinensis]ARU55626.1 hypothetical protein OLMES_1551 [Oleiphilus messinensis]MCG8610900.1 hypothetical protein [Pseudomonadales bacterium]
MELHIQKCQQCGSRNLRNILVNDESQKVYVQCRDCEQLVARYLVKPAGYFHAGKDYESFVRSLQSAGGLETLGRDIKQLYEETKANAQSEFETVIAATQDKYSDSLP